MLAETTTIETSPGLFEMATKLKFKKLDERAKLPAYAKYGDAGLDLYGIELDKETDTFIQYRTGLAVEIPKGFVGFGLSRSSISKFDVMLANGVATIDSGYRGEILLRFKKITRFEYVLRNIKQIFAYLGGSSSKLSYGTPEAKLFDLSEPIAQFIVMPYPLMAPEWADKLSDTERGSGNFGHTNAGRS